MQAGSVLPIDHPFRDFRKFMFFVWKHLNLPPPTRRQYHIASFLMNGPKRRVVEAFRGIGKSWITAAYVVWRLLNNPQLNIVVVSASKPRADNFTTFCLSLIDEVPELQHLRPRDDQRRSRESFDVAAAEPDQQPSVVSLGLTSQLAGHRADELVADDVEVPNNSSTQGMRIKLKERIKEFDMLLKPGDESRVTFLGTPQTNNSIYNGLTDRGYVIRIWPARYPADTNLYGERLCPHILKELRENPNLVGHTTEPQRFSDDDLKERELSLGRSQFELQYMLNTRLQDADRYPLRLRDLMFLSLNGNMAPDRVFWTNDPSNQLNDTYVNAGLDGDRMFLANRDEKSNYVPYKGIVMAIDPSGRGKDQTACAVIGQLNGLLYLLDCVGFSDGFETKTLHGIAQLAKKWSVNIIIAEPNFGGGMFLNLLRPVLASVYSCAVEDAPRATSNKERRMLGVLEPVIQGRRLVVNLDLINRDWDSISNYPTEVAYQYSLFHQLTHLSVEDGLIHDDKVDAITMGVAYWEDLMCQDVRLQTLKQRENIFQEAHRKHIAAYYKMRGGGGPPSKVFTPTY